MQKALTGSAELNLLREENAKWRQRVPRLTETLRLRGEALAHAQSQNRQLRESVQALEGEVAALHAAREQAAVSGDTSFDHDRLIAQRQQFEREVLSLQNRNRQLQNTVEILNTHLAAAVEDLHALRAAGSCPTRGFNVAEPSDSPAEEDARILLRIHGIGNKTLNLLMEAGIRSIKSLAGLPEETLDDPEFPLFPWRTRIRKERWVAQARDMLEKMALPPR